jgi:hypothetical protein
MDDDLLKLFANIVLLSLRKSPNCDLMRMIPAVAEAGLRLG